MQKPDKKAAGIPRQMRRCVALLCSVCMLVVLLSGCMEELQTSRPAALQPSPPLAMPTPVDQQSTPTIAQQQAPDVAGGDAQIPLPTATSTTDPAPVTLETAATTVAVAGAPITDVPGDPAPAGDTVIVPATPQALSNEKRWRDRQVDRQIFDGLQRYVTSGSDLWWFDPVNQQHLRLGSFRGEFAAQARFRLADYGEALEVPYQVNQRYGITALSPAVLDRIAAAGYDEWIETYVLLSPNVSLR